MIVGKSSTYYHYSDLVHFARILATEVSSKYQISGVAGVPRSGMLAASAAAIHLGVPLYEASLEGVRSIGHGRRLENVRNEGRILILEDSLNTGRRFRELKRKIGDSYLYASVFSTPQAIPRADFVAVQLKLPHWFDWWLWGSSFLLNCNYGIDFDGILCHDCPRDRDTDDENYRSWMSQVKPLRHAWPYGAPIAITGRLEKYRETTENWLQTNRQKVRVLQFGPWSTASERRNIAEYKAEKVKEFRLGGFVESDDRQARRIAELVRVPVVCPDANRVYNQTD